MYRLDSSFITVADSKAFGQFLKLYDIRLRGLGVWHYDGAHWRKDDPAMTTIKETAGEVALSTALTPVTTPVAAPVAAGLVMTFGPLAVMAGSLAMLGATLWAKVKLRERNGGTLEGKTVASMIEFDFGDVTARRRGWAESLCLIYAMNQGWVFSGWTESTKVRWGASWVAKNPGKMPRPWKVKGKGPVSLRRSLLRYPNGKERVQEIANDFLATNFGGYTGRNGGGRRSTPSSGLKGLGRFLAGYSEPPRRRTGGRR